MSTLPKLGGGSLASLEVNERNPFLQLAQFPFWRIQNLKIYHTLWHQAQFAEKLAEANTWYNCWCSTLPPPSLFPALTCNSLPGVLHWEDAISPLYIEGNKIWGHSQLVWKNCTPVEVTQLAQFFNGAFVMAWHVTGFLVNSATTEALQEKPSSLCIFYVLCGINYIWVSSWDEGWQGIKAQRPHELSLYFHLSDMTIFPAFER